MLTQQERDRLQEIVNRVREINTRLESLNRRDQWGPFNVQLINEKEKLQTEYNALMPKLNSESAQLQKEISSLQQTQPTPGVNDHGTAFYYIHRTMAVSRLQEQQANLADLKQLEERMYSVASYYSSL